MKKKPDYTRSELWSPRYWGTWLQVFCWRLLALLPQRAGIKVGNWLGGMLYRWMPSRRHIAEVNIRLCFPELSPEEQKVLVRKTFNANAIGLIETAWSYWRPDSFFAGRVSHKGFDILEKALEKGNGVIMLGAHHSILDLGGRLFSLYGRPYSAMYRRHNNPVMEYVINNRRNTYGKTYERKNIRAVVKALKRNETIWYGPDQDLGKKGAVFVPFFGQTAATVTATSKMVRLNDSPMVLISMHRDPDDYGYTIEIEDIPNFPTGDETEDAIVVNKAIEHSIRKAPEQYMWVHRRFKTQVDGKHRLYKEGISE